jgi:hypothetical protein
VISTHKLAAKFLPTTARIPENSLNHTITSNWDTTPYYIPIAQKGPQIERSRHNYNNLSALLQPSRLFHLSLCYVNPTHELASPTAQESVNFLATTTKFFEERA